MNIYIYSMKYNIGVTIHNSRQDFQPRLTVNPVSAEYLQIHSLKVHVLELFLPFFFEYWYIVPHTFQSLAQFPAEM